MVTCWSIGKSSAALFTQASSSRAAPSGELRSYSALRESLRTQGAMVGFELRRARKRVTSSECRRRTLRKRWYRLLGSQSLQVKLHARRVSGSSHKWSIASSQSSGGKRMWGDIVGIV